MNIKRVQILFLELSEKHGPVLQATVGQILGRVRGQRSVPFRYITPETDDIMVVLEDLRFPRILLVFRCTFQPLVF